MVSGITDGPMPNDAIISRGFFTALFVAETYLCLAGDRPWEIPSLKMWHDSFCYQSRLIKSIPGFSILQTLYLDNPDIFQRFVARPVLSLLTVP